MMNLRHPLILASNSPRRNQLLLDLGVDFNVFTKHIEEDYPADLQADEVATFLSEKKNLAYHDELRDRLIITSDTTVILDDRLLEKAADRSEAVDMLNQLSGRSHKVTTGVSIGINGTVKSFDDTTVVHFRKLEKSEIDYYVDTYQPYDKAGAYGIQEWIGQVGITSIEGSYFNVMGLPVHKVYEALKQFQI